MESLEQKRDPSLGAASKTKSLVFATVLGYVSLGFSFLNGFIFTPWISKSYTPALFGLYILANSLISLLLQDLGLSVTARTFLSKYRAEGNWEKINRLSSAIAQLYLFFDIVLFFVLFVLYFFLGDIYRGLTPEELSTFKLLYVISGFFSIVAFPTAALEGALGAYERFVWLRFFDIANRLLYMALVSTAICLHWPMYALVLINAVCGLVFFILKLFLYLYASKVHLHIFSRPKKEDIKEIFSFSVWNAVIAICWRLFNMLTPTILGIVSNSENIAIFGVASSLETYAFNICGVFNGLFTYKIAAIYTESTGGEAAGRLDVLAKKVAKIMAAILLLIVAGFSTCGQEFLSFWMDDPVYAPAFWCILVVVVCEGLTLPDTVYRSALYFNGNITHLARLQIISTLTYLLLSFPLGYFYGAIGVSVGIGISQIVLLIGSFFCYRKRLHADIKNYFIFTFGKLLLPFAVSLVGGLLLHFYLPLGRPLYKFLAIASVVLILYCPLCMFYSFSISERKELFGLMKRKK